MAPLVLKTRIFTGDPGRPYAEALAIAGGRILYVGDAGEACARAGPRARRLEFPDGLATPGLVDAHCHFLQWALSLRLVALYDLPSLAACRERIRTAARRQPPGTWIIGRGWNHHTWSEQREPCRHDLDDIAPDHPVLMVRVCGHSVWVNSRALAAAGLDRAAPDPPVGRVEREADTGMPSGLVRDARHLFEAIIPPDTPAARRAAVLEAQEKALHWGLTGVHTCEGGTAWDTFAALENEGRLKLRIACLPPVTELDAFRERGITADPRPERLWTTHGKLYADGSLGAGTALLHSPYTDEPGNSGLARMTPADLQEAIAGAYRHGFSVAIHAIGDKAVTYAVRAIGGARRQKAAPFRDRIEHVQLLRHRDLQGFLRFGIAASVQPGFVSSDWRTAERRWGRCRCRRAYAWRTLRDAGVPLLFGSDAPVEPLNPVLGLQAAVTRQTPEGEPADGWFPDQCLTLAESLDGFTRGPAEAAGRSAHEGCLRPGCRADVTVFEQDLFALPPRAWPGVSIALTLIGGECVQGSAP